MADLESEAAVDPLLEFLVELNDEFDDWTHEELPRVFGRIGAPAIPSLTRLAEAIAAPEDARSAAAKGLRYVAEFHPETRDAVVTHLTKFMAQLVEVRAVEAAATIERAFANDLVNVAICGDWETVRRRLGVEGSGLKMPKHAVHYVPER